jgi:hypothetical protein
MDIIPKTPGQDSSCDLGRTTPSSPCLDRGHSPHPSVNARSDQHSMGIHSGETPLPPALYLPVDQLEQILHSVLAHQSQSKTKDDNPLHQARLKYFVSQWTSLKFDGDHDKLVPWIKRFRSLRTNAVWQVATYIKDVTRTYDLLLEFTKVTEALIREQATARWSPDNQAKSMSQEHPDLYYSRILGKVIINSVTDEFYTMLQNYAGQDLCNDGPYLLWLILSHFHTSTITYTERIRNSIRHCNLSSDHNQDVELFLHPPLPMLNPTPLPRRTLHN